MMSNTVAFYSWLVLISFFAAPENMSKTNLISNQDLKGKSSGFLEDDI